MPSQCPQCGNSIEADFGVVTCSQCQAVLFADMDGNLQLSNNSVSTEAPPIEFSISDETPASFQDNWMQDQSPSTESNSSNLALETAISSAEQVATVRPSGAEQDEVAGEPVYFSENSEDVSNEFAAESEPSIQFLEEPAVDQEPNDLSDVSEFSNSDQPLSGTLSYSILIEKIDTKDIRQQVADALNDPKFQWDSKDLIKSIKMGQLRLEDINPVKASILIRRLQVVPVKVSWVQNVFS